jgi:hypothetical protein
MAIEVKDPAEGKVVLPRQASFYAVAGVIVTLASQFWIGATWVERVNNRFESSDKALIVARSEVDSKFEQLKNGDKYLIDRGDERFKGIQVRIETLEKDRERLLKMDSKMDYVLEAIKDLRNAIADRRDNSAPAARSRRSELNPAPQ